MCFVGWLFFLFFWCCCCCYSLMTLVLSCFIHTHMHICTWSPCVCSVCNDLVACLLFFCFAFLAARVHWQQIKMCMYLLKNGTCKPLFLPLSLFFEMDFWKKVFFIQVMNCAALFYPAIFSLYFVVCMFDSLDLIIIIMSICCCIFFLGSFQAKFRLF